MHSQEQESIKLLAELILPSIAKINLQVSFGDRECPKEMKQLSPNCLAYLGDAVYELYIRTQYLLPPKKISDYHNQVVTKVRAETQAIYLQYLQPYLTSEEQEILRRGRNAATNKPKRLALEIYQQASSLETLIGYLYLYNPQRLIQLLEKLGFNHGSTKTSIDEEVTR